MTVMHGIHVMPKINYGMSHALTKTMTHYPTIMGISVPCSYTAEHSPIDTRQTPPTTPTAMMPARYSVPGDGDVPMYNSWVLEATDI